MLNLVYFSQVTETTKQFVDKLEIPGETIRIPLQGTHQDPPPGPYILVVPTYGDMRDRRHVPHQVIRFLNEPTNRAGCIGIIATGNTNFGKRFAAAGHIISEKLQVPLLYILELAGDAQDVENVQNIINDLHPALSQQADLSPTQTTN